MGCMLAYWTPFCSHEGGGLVPGYVPHGTTGLSKHGDPVILHCCPLNQNLVRVRTGGEGGTNERGGGGEGGLYLPQTGC